MQRLRMAAIDFLNPAPLMWDFTHAPLNADLNRRYDVHLTAPAACARELLAAQADVGLIPIAALTADLAIVPGCTIASLNRVRSIQLVVNPGRALDQVRTVAADTASRSSVAYAEILFRHFLRTDPHFIPAPADLAAMLAVADAALLIGDPALLALEHQPDFPGCTWFDLASEWNQRTGLPWVAAVWAARPEAIAHPALLIQDLNASSNHGGEHTEDLVREWTARIALPAETIRTYLTQNIHYALDAQCIAAITLFRRLAAEVGALPPLPNLSFLTPNVTSLPPAAS